MYMCECMFVWQSECWAPLMSGRDVIGIAATGSGKTLAFLVPALLKLAHMAAGGGAAAKGRVPQPKVLIIAPTRYVIVETFCTSLDVSIHTHTYTHMHTRTHTYIIHTYIHTYTYVHT